MLGKTKTRTFMLNKTEMRMLMLDKTEFKIFMLGKTEMRILMLGKNKMWILKFGKTKLRFLLLGKTELWRQGGLRLASSADVSSSRLQRLTELPLWFHATAIFNLRVHLRQGLLSSHRFICRTLPRTWQD